MKMDFFFLLRMESKNLLFGFLLYCILLTITYSHMVIEENTEQSLANSNKMNLPDLPPISIVELTKASRKISRKEAEKKISSKKKTAPKRSPETRPTPANCVATSKSCKPYSNPCCDFCAFCHCRIFQTVCYCRRLNC
ncbi:PREDICTED: agouti-signaling protein isoform X1 [Crocodylus porosus]|uniref:Agouti-signaling protein n=2 Tax=Crocodylus porosus TaxID=8502 RepID=A0A7M4F273_CROPO|nr:PREDICTED: agouti-signaling protein isoform X1 [Crocodylus porosus]